MSDFRLQVFQSAARHLNFTKAAKELFITQPAVTKHIKELESEYGLRLFERKGNMIFLTAAGKILLHYTEKIFSIYSELEFDLNHLKNKFSGHLRLGASTTISQYVIPPVLALFQERFQNIGLSLINANTERIEMLLQNNEIDLGIVEGIIHNKDLKYTPFLEDDLVAVINARSGMVSPNEITLDSLLKKPMVLRERGSGTLAVIEHAFKKRKIKLSELKVLMYLGSTESIKSFLTFSDCVGFVPLRAIERETASGQLRILPIKNFRITRQLQFIQPQGQTGGLSALFIKFALYHYTSR